MNRLTNLGLRTRLAIALVSVAVLAVGLATLLVNRSVDGVVDDAARSRLQRSAEHMAEVAATVAQSERGWSAAARVQLLQLAELDGLRISVRADRVRFGTELPAGRSAAAPIVVDGRAIGSIEVALVGEGLLTPEERHLRHRLDRLHLAAGAASVGAALILAFLLAETLSRPLRRIRLGAQRLGGGDLDARVDLTGDPEVRSVAHALNRLAETLGHQEAVRKQTVADLSHELRTPVNGLLVRIEAAQDGVLNDRENLAAMHEEALRLTRLLDDLSRLADAERPGLLVDKQRLDLDAVARSVAESFAPRFVDAGVEFAVAGRAVFVHGDPSRLEQIVANLLSNALRYTGRGGRVELRIESGDDTAMLEVVDTGIGIPADDLSHVFTRFWRGDPSRSRATGGTGIGLSIVRELVRAHDGRIDVESTPGEGSRFRVTLPAAGPSDPAPGPVVPQERMRMSS